MLWGKERGKEGKKEERGRKEREGGGKVKGKEEGR